MRSPKADTVEQQQSSNTPTFRMSISGRPAWGREIANQFVVLKGSAVRKLTTGSLRRTYAATRERLVREGKLGNGPDENFWVFTQDVPFASPSQAAAIIEGGSRNGRQSWKVENTKQTYAEWSKARMLQK